MTKRKVLVTGAAGTVAGLLYPALRRRYELTLLDVRTTNSKGEEVEGIQVADLTNPDREQYRHHFQGIDTVVHLSLIQTRDKNDTDRYFRNEFTNIQMAYNVYQTAWEEGVRRVVVASSNHAADYYEPLILRGEWDFVTPHVRPLSDNYYGWAKEVTEHLGFVFAVGKMNGGKMNGRPLENVQVRIGGPRETDLERMEPGDLVRMRRSLAVYISPRDLQQIFVKSIETEDIRDEQGVPFQVVYGISGNDRKYWPLSNARRVLGYEPEDNSEIRFSELIRAHVQAAQEKGIPQESTYVNP